MSTGWCPRSLRASPPPARTSADRLRRVLAVRQLPVRPGEVAGVPAPIALEVVRVLGLGLPEPDGLTDLGHDLAGPQARGVDVGDRVLGHLALLVARGEDLGPIVGAGVPALAVLGRRVVDLEEGPQETAAGKDRGLGVVRHGAPSLDVAAIR